MPTTDELQSQINALQSQLNAILGMADDDYIHQYSGEEIDAGITAAGKAVRYDLAQSLAAAQQAQARGNIAAAPNGYGYGDNAHGFFANPDSDGSVATAFFDSLLDQMGNGVTIRGSFVDYPYIVDTANGGEYELLRGSASSAIATITIFGGGGAGPYRLTWTKYNNAWRAPEWVNPPLALGVEYRTTERYLGKPVYVQVVDSGLAPNNSTKNVNISVNIERFVSIFGMAYADSLHMHTIPDVTNSIWIQLYLSGTIPQIYIKTTNSNWSINGYHVYALIKYTKTTD